MTSGWAKVQLAEVIAERKEVPSVDDLATGKVRIVAKVGFNDGRIQFRADGQTKTGMILIRPGDLVISGINAAKGAVAVYREDNTEPVAATIHYGAYIPNKARVDISYLWWLLRSRAFRDLLLQYVPGGIKTELKAKRLLPIPIPLPPLSEQRRIVARIEELAAKIEEARRLRTEAAEEAKAFASSLHLHMAGERFLRLDAFLMLEEVRENVRLGQEYPQVGVKGFGEGLFEKGSVDGSQTTYKAFNRLYYGAVVLSQVKGWEGALAVCCSDLSGRYVSPEYRTFRCVSELAKPEYLAVIFATPWFWTQLKNMTRGVGARRERIRPEQFLRMEIPMPTIQQQTWAMQLLARLSDLSTLQAETRAELDALYPPPSSTRPSKENCKWPTTSRHGKGSFSPSFTTTPR